MTAASWLAWLAACGLAFMIPVWLAEAGRVTEALREDAGWLSLVTRKAGQVALCRYGGHRVAELRAEPGIWRDASGSRHCGHDPDGNLISHRPRPPEWL